jgi:cyclopropane fatty-acyl-phospholipid synthase-like methyltransferase
VTGVQALCAREGVSSDERRARGNLKLRKVIYSPYRWVSRDTYDTSFVKAHADLYERKTRWTKMRLANVQELIDPQPGDKVLDLGCAAGSMAHFLSTFGCEAVGADYAPAAIELARELYPDMRFEQADCSDLPFDENSFDKIVAADLTEHLDQPTLDGMFSESFRVLRPGGTLSIHTPNPRHLIERLKAKEFLLAQNPTHIGLRTREELEKQLRHSGFEIEWSDWRRSHIPVFRTFEVVGGQVAELFRYRICICAKKPAMSGSMHR